MIEPRYGILQTLFADRVFRIPHYQRFYSWQNRQREDLFADIRKLARGSEDQHHFMATLVCHRTFIGRRQGAGLSLLKHLEDVKDQIVTTYQVEIEFKSNRQGIIRDSYNALKAPSDIQKPGIFWDAKTAKALANDLKNAQKRVNALKQRLQNFIKRPHAR